MSLNNLAITEEEINDVLRCLSSSDVNTRVHTLKILCIDPIKDTRVVEHLRKLLSDTGICLINIPYLYGEVRWLAAKALHVSTNETIQLSRVIVPLGTEEYTELRDEVGIETKGGVDGVLAGLQVLRDMEELPVVDMVF